MCTTDRNGAINTCRVIVFAIALVSFGEAFAQANGSTGGDRGPRTEADWRLLFDHDTALDLASGSRDGEALRGFWLVVVTAVIVGAVVPGLMRSRSMVMHYRRYERRLLRLDRIALDDLLQYHAQFKWGSYSAVAIGMVLVSIPLMISSRGEFSSTEFTIQAVIVVVMSVAVVLLVLADLVHTNTQTPIVPVEQRFRLLDLSVWFGTLGTLSLVFCVLLFAALVSLIVTAVACAVCVSCMMMIQCMRRIPKSDLFDYFGIRDPESWTKLGVRLAIDADDDWFRGDRGYIGTHARPSGAMSTTYQKMRGSRPAPDVVDGWLRAMRVRGLLRLTESDYPQISTEGWTREACEAVALEDLEKRLESFSRSERTRVVSAVREWMSDLDSSVFPLGGNPSAERQ